MVESFKAAILHDYNQPMTIETVTLAPLKPTDVLVKIEATSVCHTDLEVYQGGWPNPIPAVLGHEGAGVVADVGAAVADLKPGDKVALHWSPHCGTCYYCEQGQRILCQQYKSNAAKSFHFDGEPRLYLDGAPLHQLMYLGTFAEYCIVDAQCAVKMPDAMPSDRSCLLGCGVMTGYGAATNIAPTRVGSSVAVIGCGALGLSAIQGALHGGAAVVMAIDLNDDKLALAKQLGATHVCNSGREDPIAAIKAVTEGRGADFVYEAAGHKDVFPLSVELSRFGGEIVWLGKVAPGTDITFPWMSLMMERKMVRSSYGGAQPHRDFKLMADAYLRDALKLDEIVTGTMGLADVNEAFEILARGEAVRTVLDLTIG